MNEAERIKMAARLINVNGQRTHLVSLFRAIRELERSEREAEETAAEAGGCSYDGILTGVTYIRSLLEAVLRED